jgi:hypothetical protein
MSKKFGVRVIYRKALYRSEQSVASPREGEGPTLGVVGGEPPRDGRTLGAVRGPPARAPRAWSVWMPLEMTEEYKHKRRTMGRAT